MCKTRSRGSPHPLRPPAQGLNQGASVPPTPAPPKQKQARHEAHSRSPSPTAASNQHKHTRIALAKRSPTRGSSAGAIRAYEHQPPARPEQELQTAATSKIRLANSWATRGGPPKPTPTYKQNESWRQTQATHEPSNSTTLERRAGQATSLGNARPTYGGTRWKDRPVHQAKRIQGSQTTRNHPAQIGGGKGGVAREARTHTWQSP